MRELCTFSLENYQGKHLLSSQVNTFLRSSAHKPNHIFTWEFKEICWSWGCWKNTHSLFRSLAAIPVKFSTAVWLIERPGKAGEIIWKIHEKASRTQHGFEMSTFKIPTKPRQDRKPEGSGEKLSNELIHAKIVQETTQQRSCSAAYPSECSHLPPNKKEENKACTKLLQIWRFFTSHRS